MGILAGKADLLRRMPEMARGMGVSDAVVDRAMIFCDLRAASLETLDRRSAVHAPRQAAPTRG